jgi:hypothetical protein
MDTLLSESAPAQPVDGAATVAELPRSVQAIVDAWNGFKAAADQFHCHFEELHEAERSAREVPNDEEYRMVLYRYDVEIDVKKIAERARDALKRVAEKTFSPDGARLEVGIPHGDDFPPNDWETFDPAAIWRYLAATYGGDVGANLAYRAAAKKLAYDLGIKPGIEPKVVGGRMIFEISTYPDKKWGEVIGFRDPERVGAILGQFQAVGEWSGVWGLEETNAVEWAVREAHDARSNKVLPERRAIGSLVLVVPFKSKWEFRVSLAFAEKMQLFLAEFGGQADE